MEITPTRYSIDMYEWIYTATKVPLGWSLTRYHKTTKAVIPPNMEILTIEGWRPLCNYSQKLNLFNDMDDVKEYLTDDGAN